ncbi:hypothetical protein B0H17DRAFT_1200823 [Mycena rosella]|uniref:Bacteriophage T5 Orf172 DNA-binding domain-containing protein n=1 Tax=Mycena rosella TaxID=1033263 RepID=A0AAD7GFE0_MYCRO|nr:hypothetical protein B0H17DRAFT_1200823 [Mycena rosella]
MNAAIVPWPNLPRVTRAVLRALLSAHPLPHMFVVPSPLFQRHTFLSRALCRPFEQVLALLQLGSAVAYQNEGLGVLYLQTRPGPNGTEFKFGHTNDLDRRLAQYRVCGNTIRTWAYFPTPNRMIAERVIFLLFLMLGAKAPSRPCPGCDVGHREFLNLSAAGGWASVLAVVQLGIVITGGVYQILRRHLRQFDYPCILVARLSLDLHKAR